MSTEPRFSSTTRLDDVIQYLIETFGAATGLPAKDGPDEVDSTSEDTLFVGVRLDDPGDAFVGEVSGEQSFRYTGDRIKEERATVPLSLLLWSGDDQTRARRERAIAMWQRCERAHRLDLPLGDRVVDSDLTDFRMVYIRTNRGNAVSLTFTLTYRALLQPHTEGA